MWVNRYYIGNIFINFKKQVTCKMTFCISAFTEVVNSWLVLWKHHKTMPPLLKIVNKSNIFTNCSFLLSKFATLTSFHMFLHVNFILTFDLTCDSSKFLTVYHIVYLFLPKHEERCTYYDWTVNSVICTVSHILTFAILRYSCLKGWMVIKIKKFINFSILFCLIRIFKLLQQ